MYCRSALDHDAFPGQALAHAIAQISLQLNRAFVHGATRSTRTLQLLTQLPEKPLIVRQAAHDGHGLAAAPLRLHPQLSDDSTGNCVLRRGPAAAPAVVIGPSAPRTDAAQPGRVHEPGLVAIAHDPIISRPRQA